MGRLLIIVLLMSAVVFPSRSQVKIIGKTLHYITQKKVAVSQINVVDLDSSHQYSVVISSGKYKLDLKRDKVYRVEFTKDGFYNKFVKIDTRGVPSNKKVSMYIEMDLVQKVDGFNADLFRQPVGIAHYDADWENMRWDVEYSRKMFEKLDAEFKRAGLGTKTDQPKDPEPKDTAAPKPPEQPKDVLPGEVDDELYVPLPPNPFRLVHHIRTELPGGIIEPAAQLEVPFKKQLFCGAVLAELAMGSDELSVAQFTALTSALGKELQQDLAPSLPIKSYQVRLANAAGKADSTDNILGDMYFSMVDMLRGNGIDENLMHTAGWLEVMHRTLDVYTTSPSKALNTFIGEQEEQLWGIVDYLETRDLLQSDAELSFKADVVSLQEVVSKIEYKPGGEMVSADGVDEPMYFQITPEIRDALKAKISRIRKAFVADE